MKILVTGAAGFIGSHLAERLCARGDDVVGADCFTDYYDVSLKEKNAQAVRAAGAELRRLDLAMDELKPAIENVEVIYHLAAQPGISAQTSFETYVRNNITATHRLIEAASKLDSLRAFVNVSTSSVYGKNATDPGSDSGFPQHPRE